MAKNNVPKNVRCSFCGKSQDSVKKIAKFIAPSNNDNGVFKVLNHYLNEANK